MYKLHIVIPIGVSSPGTPIPEFLLNGIESLKSQTLEDILITVAADENIPDIAKNILIETGVNVEWFSAHSYFSKEGMWGKIFRCWEKYDSEFVSFLHYDDLWEGNKALNQINFIEKNNLDGCWSQVYLINDQNEITSGDSMGWTEFRKEYVGQFHPWIPHSTVVKKEAILDSGILEFREKWSGEFEGIYCTFLQKIKNLKKCDDAIFLWRTHANQVSWNVQEDKDYVQSQREATGYTLAETMDDASFVKQNIDLETIKQLY
jgi:hypothetical protein